MRKYETVATEGQPVSFTSIDQAPDDAFEVQSIGIPTGRFVEKEDIVKGSKKIYEEKILFLIRLSLWFNHCAI